MKTVRTHIIRALALFSVLVMSSIRSWASPQQPEFLIVGNDTLPIFQLLLPGDMQERLNRYVFDNSDYLDPLDDFVVTTALGRGYQGLWELADDTLYLLGFKKGSGLLGPERMFPDKIKDGKVMADWYDSTLIIPKGSVLRWDGIFCRTYVEEEHLTFRHGHVSSRKTVHNYIDLPEGINRMAQNPFSPGNEIAEVLFNQIVSVETDWNALDERSLMGVMGDYLVTIGANGKVVSVTDEEGKRSVVTRLFKRRLRGLQFDIIKFNGKPFKDRIVMYIDLDESNNRLVLEKL